MTKPVKTRDLFHALERLLHPDGAETVIADSPVAEPRSFDAEVLVAEDNPINQRVAAAMLERLGCRVTAAESGEKALAAFSGGGFDLVLMDCEMPGMDGYDASRAIRSVEQERELERTPIVAVTANAGPRTREECFVAGMDAFVAKPMRLSDLRAALSAWL